MLFTPSNTPQFNPIENSFAYVKKRLCDAEFNSKEDLVEEVISQFFSLHKRNLDGFFRKTLDNIL